MESPSPIILPNEARGRFGSVKSLLKAAVLMSLGFRPMSLAVEKIRRRNDGRPPDFHFNISGGSDTWTTRRGGANSAETPLERREVLQQVNHGGASVELDELIAEIPDAETRTRIANTLPLAYAENIAAGISQYKECIRRVKEAPVTIQCRTRTGGHAKIPPGRADLARRWGADNNY